MKPYYVLKIEEEFLSRKQRNSSYSLRAYACFLGMYSGTLSAILKTKRPLPEKAAKHVIDKLKLSSRESKLFQDSLREFKASRSPETSLVTRLPDRVLGESEFQVISSWEHYAILSLMRTENFKSDSEWIAKRLGISVDQAELAIENLYQVNLISEDADGKLEVVFDHVASTEVPADKDEEKKAAIVSSVLETLDIAKEKFQTISPYFTFYVFETLAIDIRKMPEAKTLILKFFTELSNLVESGSRTEVYRFAAQLFPLSQVQAESEKKDDLG